MTESCRRTGRNGNDSWGYSACRKQKDETARGEGSGVLLLRFSSLESRFKY